MIFIMTSARSCKSSGECEVVRQTYKMYGTLTRVRRAPRTEFLLHVIPVNSCIAIANVVQLSKLLGAATILIKFSTRVKVSRGLVVSSKFQVNPRPSNILSSLSFYLYC